MTRRNYSVDQVREMRYCIQERVAGLGDKSKKGMALLLNSQGFKKTNGKKFVASDVSNFIHTHMKEDNLPKDPRGRKPGTIFKGVHPPKKRRFLLRLEAYEVMLLILIACAGSVAITYAVLSQ
ncbi:MAG: hypothetical protein DRQ88_13000 [Epsilonproteobacteria bacterium]|nr:MAG: hypothetical protein DRQ88_13000 [Campylobacterota bacterium]